MSSAGSHYLSQYGVCQSQNAVPVNTRDEEAIGGENGCNVDCNGAVWAFGDGNLLISELPFPVSLGVFYGHRFPKRLIGSGAEEK